MEKESEKRSVLVFLVVRKSVLKVRRKAEMIRIVATTSVRTSKATVYGTGELTKVNALRQAVPIAKAIKMNHKIAVGSSPSWFFPPSPSVTEELAAAASARRRRRHIVSRENRDILH